MPFKIAGSVVWGAASQAGCLPTGAMCQELERLSVQGMPSGMSKEGRRKGNILWGAGAGARHEQILPVLRTQASGRCKHACGLGA